MQDMAELFSRTEIDFYVGGNDLAICNMTGHPTVILPDGFVEEEGMSVPTSITFTGRLYDESTLLAVAHAFQEGGDWHRRRPPLGPHDETDRARGGRND